MVRKADLRRLAFVAAMAWAIAPATADQVISGDCLIVVAGHKQKDGRCRITLFPGGGFQTGGEKAGEAFAIVDLDAALTAKGYWNGTDRDSHAHEDLGALRKEGACWVNDTARVCAWRPGTRP